MLNLHNVPQALKIVKLPSRTLLMKTVAMDHKKGQTSLTGFRHGKRQVQSAKSHQKN